MKKLSLSLFCLMVSVIAFAQTDTISEKPIIDRTVGKNEIKLNFLYSVIEFYDDHKSMSFHIPEIQYERKLGSEVSAGLSFWTSGTDDLKYLIIPHIRVYFGKKSNNFFMELNTAILKGLTRSGMNHAMPMPMPMPQGDRMMITSLGIGGALGYKFLIGNGFIMETYLGAGRSIEKGNDYSTRIIYPRAGITMGQRF